MEERPASARKGRSGPTTVPDVKQLYSKLHFKRHVSSGGYIYNIIYAYNHMYVYIYIYTHLQYAAIYAYVCLYVAVYVIIYVYKHK